jgi:FtsP/CotA-like multicopper oxidase with cupredoxin domain
MMLGEPLELAAVGTCYRILAIEGGDLNAPQCLGPERLRFGIGQRYDLGFVMPATGQVRILDVHGRETVTVGDGSSPALPQRGRLPLFDLLSYGRAAADPVLQRGFDVTDQIVLGEEGGIRNLQPELIHTINGRAAPMATTFVVHAGQLVRLHIVNQTDEFHTMHLHGHVLAVPCRTATAGFGAVALSTSTRCWWGLERDGTWPSAPTTPGSGCCTATCSCTRPWE